MRSLSTAYIAEADHISVQEWSALLLRFDDATINQTWSYGAVRWGENNLSHLVLKKDGDVVAAAQLRIVKIPVLKSGIAYISWGPMWRLRGQKRNLEHLRQMLRALFHEYVSRRGLFLRVLSNVFDCDPDAVFIRSIFIDEGYQHSDSPYRTLLLDLGMSLEQLRANLSKDWRKNLKKAEGNDLLITEGSDDALYETVRNLYNEMLERKSFVPLMDVNQFAAMQKDLPDSLKMRIMLCEIDGEPIAALVGSGLGNTGIELVAATSEKALKVHASYLLRWRMVQWLKEHGCCLYDLGGIDPIRNPGTYQFKAGLSGKAGKDTRHIGQFEACRSFLSAFAVKVGDRLRSHIHLK